MWQFVESRQEFSNWIKGRIEKYGFVEDEDFTVDKFINGRATVIDYHLTIETAKKLAMVENNEKGRQVRRYLIECERLIRESTPALPDFSNPAIAARAWAEQFEQREKLAVEHKAQGEAELRHADFLAKVPQVLGAEMSEKFRSSYKDSMNRKKPAYTFPKREACLMAMSYSLPHRHAVNNTSSN